MHQSQDSRLHTGQKGILSCVECVGISEEGCQSFNNCEKLNPYWSRRLELSIHDGCILCGQRVVVPSKGKDYMLAELHIGHPGVSRMKALPRFVVSWTGLDGMVEDAVKSCVECQQTQPLPTSAPMQP